MNINHESITPLYHQIKEELLEQIESNLLRENEMIPSELELQAIFNVSRPTVRQAVSELIQSGHLYRKRGVGTFVSKPRIERDAQELLGFTEEMKKRGITTSSVDINLSINTPSKSLATKLKVSESDLIITIKRLRLADDEPIGIHTSYIPYTILPKITIHDLKGIQSLYGLFKNRFNINMAYAEEIIEATSASEEEASLLSIDIGYPVLFVRRFVYSEGDDLIEMAEMVYPANRYKYHTRLIRKTQNFIENNWK